MTPTPAEPDRSSVEAYRRWLLEADDDALLDEEMRALFSNPSLKAGAAEGLTARLRPPPQGLGSSIALRADRLNARLRSLLDEIAEGLRPDQISRSLAILGNPGAGIDGEDQAVIDIVEPDTETGLVTLPVTVIDLLGRRTSASLEHDEGEARFIVNGVRPGFSGMLLVGLNREDGEDEIVVAERSRPDQFVAVLPWFEPYLPPQLGLLATAD